MIMGKSKDVAAVVSNTHNVLAARTNLKGEISSEEDFRIDGSIDGNILCRGKIIVGQSGSIKGNIDCVNIEIFGRVAGNITCKDSLVLRATARMTGEMKMQVIEIEPGAQMLECALSMTGESSGKTQVPSE
jgi:cytoskeletal protein CcmA (bactofilin family)